MRIIAERVLKPESSRSFEETLEDLQISFEGSVHERSDGNSDVERKSLYRLHDAGLPEFYLIEETGRYTQEEGNTVLNVDELTVHASDDPDNLETYDWFGS